MEMCAYCAAPHETAQDNVMNLLTRSLVCVVTVALCAGATTPLNSDRTVVSFSDPSRPGTLAVRIVMGGIVIKGADVKDVTIDSHGRDHFHGPIPPDPEEESRGLRRLMQGTSITVEERDNRITIESPVISRPVDMEIQVPRRTNLALSSVNAGNITVEGVDGELEVGNVNGSITLENVGGSVVAHTVNGRVVAKLTRVTPQKSMAFTSLNGAVDVSLPATAKANLKLRSDNGSIFTDFDVHLLQDTASPVSEDTRGEEGGRYKIEVNKAVYGSVNGGGPEIEARTFNGNVYVRKGN
jgi:DUF4097 and DUF4098 domain-containing protein YvlB